MIKFLSLKDYSLVHNVLNLCNFSKLFGPPSPYSYFIFSLGYTFLIGCGATQIGRYLCAREGRPLLNSKYRKTSALI